MNSHTATAQASPNIAFIKYWGNRDSALRLPVNGSISMNLEGLYTRTTVSFQPSLALDDLVINGHQVMGKGLERVASILEHVRQAAGIVGLSAHNCRHYWATQAARNGAPLDQL